MKSRTMGLICSLANTPLADQEPLESILLDGQQYLNGRRNYRRNHTESPVPDGHGLLALNVIRKSTLADSV